MNAPFRSSRDVILRTLVPDVQAAKKSLLAAGCTVQEEDPSVPRCYIRDPYGLVFNLGKAESTGRP